MTGTCILYIRYKVNNMKKKHALQTYYDKIDVISILPVNKAVVPCISHRMSQTTAKVVYKLLCILLNISFFKILKDSSCPTLFKSKIRSYHSVSRVMDRIVFKHVCILFHKYQARFFFTRPLYCIELSNVSTKINLDIYI